MNIDLTIELNRKKVLEEMRNYENIKRKEESLTDYEIYNGRIYGYVYNQLVRQLSEQTAKQMPIVASINLAERITDNEATIYTSDPKRSLLVANESDKKPFEDLYLDCGFNTKFQKVNKYYKLRNQGFIQVVPKNKKISLRVLQSHHVDVIPDESDPETAYAYIVSAFDKSQYLISDQTNQVIAEPDDYKKSLDRITWWTAEYNMITDGAGKLVGEIADNQIKELPFVDVSKDKDFEFFVRQGQALTDFTVQYNMFWTDFFYTARMQGFSLGVFRGDPELMPKHYFVGPNRFMVLPTNPANPDQTVDFKFESPSPDLDGLLKGISAILASYLTSKGVSPKVVSADMSSADRYSSGLERLLAMVDKFEATKEDFDLFRMVEQQVFGIVKKYQVLFSNTDLLNRKYWVSSSFESAEMTLRFNKPEMVQSESEKLTNLKTKIEMGISDKSLALSQLEEISIEQAEEKILEIQQRKANDLLSIVDQAVNEAETI